MAAKCASVTSKIQTALGGIIKPCGWEAFTTVGSSKTIWPGIDYVNSQHLAAPLVCLGDGHDGVWNIFREIATTQERWEIQGLVSPQGKSL